jgi:ABC-type lipoprotein export system ATPase subunit
VLSLLQGLVHERGHSLLVVTHDPSVRSIADRVLTIRDGRLAQ